MLKMFTILITFQLIAVSVWAGPAGDEALHEAASNLDVDAVKAALEKGANPNAVLQPRNRTPLQAVAYGGYFTSESRDIANSRALEVVEILFAKGARLSVHDKEILWGPIASGNTQLVSLLLDRGASPTAKLAGYTPTEFAIKHAQGEAYKLLIARGGIPVAPRTRAQLFLVEAASMGGVEAMKIAVKEGADINVLDPAYKTALVEALKHINIKNFAAVKWLLDAGADANTQSFEENSSFVGREGMVEGIPLHVLVWSYGYALDNATLEKKALAEETLTRLLRAGAKVSGMDSKSRTPLHIAATFGHVRAAEILIRAGARVMARDEKGRTPLDYAESASMIQLLKKHGATER